MKPVDPRDVVVHLRDLPVRRREFVGKYVEVEGIGLLHDQDCTHIECEELTFAGDTSFRGWLRSRKKGPTLLRCDFSGLRTRHFDPQGARFHDCEFRDIDVAFGLGTAVVELVGCIVSGRLEGTISCGSGRRRVRVAGNDFRQATGVSFQDGVDWRDNVFDLGFRHLVLTRAAAADPSLVRLLHDTPDTGIVAGSLLGRGPLYLGQDWALLHQGDFSAARWAQLVDSLTPLTPS